MSLPIVVPTSGFGDTPEKPKESDKDKEQRKKDEEFLETPIQNKKDGLFYYLLPVGNNLYRGDDKIRVGDKFKDRVTYFGTNKDSVQQYGKVFKIVTDREYKLLALDKVDTIAMIFKDAPDIVKEKLSINYGYKLEFDKEKHKLIRTSDNTKTDNIVSDYLCENGYDGYAINNMETAFGGTFHKEVMICKPSGLIIDKELTGEIISNATNGNPFATPDKKKPTKQYVTPGGKKSKRKITKKRKTKRKSRTYKK